MTIDRRVSFLTYFGNILEKTAVWMIIRRKKKKQD